MFFYFNVYIKIAHALQIGHKKGQQTEISSKIDVSRESFYRSLSQRGKAKFTTLINAIRACGLKIDFPPI